MAINMQVLMFIHLVTGKCLNKNMQINIALNMQILMFITMHCYVGA